MRNSQKRQVVVNDFWHPTEAWPDTALYTDQLGWTVDQKVESGGYTDTFDVWQHLIALKGSQVVGFDLSFYFPEDGNCYYLDNAEGTVYRIAPRSDWDGHHLSDCFLFPDFDREEADEVFEFGHAQEVWEGFTVKGHDMKYILEHSALGLSI